MEAAEWVGDRCVRIVAHPQCPGLVIGRAKAVMPCRKWAIEREWLHLPVAVVEILDVVGDSGDSLCEGQRGLVHHRPGLSIGGAEVEVDVGAWDAELVVFEWTQVDPATVCIRHWGCTVTVHFPD